jgi:hypothetical protein
MANFFNGNSDDDSRYLPNNQAPFPTDAMLEASHRQIAADRARAAAQAEAEKARLQREDIARRVELSVSRNEQLLAHQAGASRQHVSSQSVSMIAPPEVIDQTPLNWGGIQLGPKQAQQMVDTGQISIGEYQRMLSDALAAKGLRAPGSFR